MSVSQGHKELFGRLYHSIWNERRMEFIDLVIAETHAISDPTVAGGAVGPSAYRRQVERFLTGLPDLHFDVDDTITEKDKLVVYWTITGTHRGEFLGVPATNKKVSLAGSPSIKSARAKSSNPQSSGMASACSNNLESSYRFGTRCWPLPLVDYCVVSGHRALLLTLSRQPAPLFLPRPA